MGERRGCSERLQKELPSSGAASGCWEIHFPLSHFTSLGPQDWICTGERSSLLHCLIGFYRNHSSTSFFPVLLLLLANPTACFPPISLRDFSLNVKPANLWWHSSFLSLLKSSTSSSTNNSYVTCPCNKLHISKKSFITSHMKILS